MTPLLFHQLKTDFRSQRTFLIFWISVLSLHLCMLLGWVGAPSHTWPFEDGWLMQMLPTILGSMMAFLPLVLTLAILQQDSPARPTGFLRTRPIPIQTLFLSKSLFLLVGIALPMVLFEGLHLFLGQLPLEIVGRGMLERMTLVIPALVLIALPSVALRDARSLALFLPWTYFCCLLGLGALVLLSRMPGGDKWVPQSQNWDGFSLACRLALILVAPLSLAWLAWACRQRRPSWKILLAWFPVILIAEWGGWAGRPIFRPSGNQPDEVAKWAESASMQIQPEDLSAFFKRRADDQVSIGWKTQVDLSGLPENWFVIWANRESQLTLSPQWKKTQRQSFSLEKMFNSLPFFTRKELRSMKGLAPEGALMEVHQYDLVDQDIFVTPIEIPDPTHLTDPPQLEMSMEGHVCRWIEAAVLPLEAGQSASHAQTRWSIRGLEFPVNRKSVELLLEESDPRLHLSRPNPGNNAGFQFENRFRYALYDSAHNQGQILTERPQVVRSLGGHLTAISHRWIKLSFQERQVEQLDWNANNSSLELRIYEREYLGPFTKSFTVNLPLRTLHPGLHQRNNLPVERIQKPDYIRRRQALPTPPQQASESEVRQYLAAALRLFEAYQRLEDSDPLLQGISGLARHHAPTLLNALEHASPAGSRLLLKGLHLGLGQEQKEMILQRAIHHPELATLLKSRVWYLEARPVIASWIQSPMELPLDAIRLLLWLELPEADRRVLRAFRHQPNRQLHELLSSIPRLEHPLEVEIRKIWDAYQTPWQPTTVLPNAYELALSHGIQEAAQSLVRRIIKQRPDYPLFNHTALPWMNRFFPDEAPKPRGWVSYELMREDLRRRSAKAVPTFEPAWQTWTFEPLPLVKP